MADPATGRPAAGPDEGRYRLGRSLGTTIYDRHNDREPVGWFPNRPDLARRAVDALNAAEHPRPAGDS